MTNREIAECLALVLSLIWLGYIIRIIMCELDFNNDED